MLIITAAERLESPCRRAWLGVNYIEVYNFGSSLTNIIHPTNPLHLIISFEFFGYTLTLCHLLYKPRKHFFSLLVEACKVSVQFAACKQIKK